MSAKPRMTSLLYKDHLAQSEQRSLLFFCKPFGTAVTLGSPALLATPLPINESGHYRHVSRQLFPLRHDGEDRPRRQWPWTSLFEIGHQRPSRGAILLGREGHRLPASQPSFLDLAGQRHHGLTSDASRPRKTGGKYLKRLTTFMDFILSDSTS